MKKYSLKHFSKTAADIYKMTGNGRKHQVLSLKEELKGQQEDLRRFQRAEQVKYTLKA